MPSFAIPSDCSAAVLGCMSMPSCVFLRMISLSIRWTGWRHHRFIRSVCKIHGQRQARPWWTTALVLVLPTPHDGVRHDLQSAGSICASKHPSAALIGWLDLAQVLVVGPALEQIDGFVNVDLHAIARANRSQSKTAGPPVQHRPSVAVIHAQHLPLQMLIKPERQTQP